MLIQGIGITLTILGIMKISEANLILSPLPFLSNNKAEERLQRAIEKVQGSTLPVLRKIGEDKLRGRQGFNDCGSNSDIHYWIDLSN